MANNGTVVMFGGTGFIGTHFAKYWLQQRLASKIVLVDVAPPRNEPYTRQLQKGLKDGGVEFVRWDVRDPVPRDLVPVRPDIVFNLAAVHREPGHQPHEYYDTNLKGAENVCSWAASINCDRMVFTSSISPYGASEAIKDEDSLPIPETPYGGSKLVAEKIHQTWQAGSPDRKLLILRPGVVFGPGEGGNVTRLLRSVIKGYFVYVSNKDTRKAGIYIKEFARIAHFGLDHQDQTGDGVTLLNAGMYPTPRLEDFVSAARKAAGVRKAPANIPRQLLVGASIPIDLVSRTLGIKQPVSPVRIRKLYRSTYVVPKRLKEWGYTWKYSMDDAFLDWKAENPADFARRPESK